MQYNRSLSTTTAPDIHAVTSKRQIAVAIVKFLAVVKHCGCSINHYKTVPFENISKDTTYDQFLKHGI